jgi:hypothetical protein
MSDDRYLVDDSLIFSLHCRMQHQLARRKQACLQASLQARSVYTGVLEPLLRRIVESPLRTPDRTLDRTVAVQTHSIMANLVAAFSKLAWLTASERPDADKDDVRGFFVGAPLRLR